MTNQLSVREIVKDESDEDEDEEESSLCTSGGFWVRLKGHLELYENTILCQYLLDSSLQGFKYVGQPGQPIQRLFWIFTITVALVITGFLIYIGVVRPLLGNPIMISFQSSEITIDQIPFPAFTLCSANQAKKSHVDKLRRVVDEYLGCVRNNTTAEYLEKFGEIPSLEMEALGLFSTHCGGLKSFRRKFGYGAYPKFLINRTKVNGTVGSSNAYNSSFHGIGVSRHIHYLMEKVMWKAMTKCSEVLLKCLWRNKEVPCMDIFSPVRTPAGRCCVFNMMPEFIMRGFRKDDPRVDRNERNINESVAAAWRSWNVDENLVDPSSGVKDAIEYPRHQRKAGMWNGLSILVNPQLWEYNCVHGDGNGFRVQAHSPLELPHVGSLGKGIGPNEEVFVGVTARIITGDSRELKSYSFEKRQCYFVNERDLKNFKIYRKESCIDECIANDTWHQCGCVNFNQPREANRSYCVLPEKIKCAFLHIEKMTKKGIKQKCSTCIPSCTSVEYISQFSRMPIRNDVKLWRKHDTGIDELWANESLSIIHVFFASDYVESRVRKTLYGIKAIIADTGGLLGISLGFSLISFVEPLYFFTLRCIFDKKRGKMTSDSKSKDASLIERKVISVKTGEDSKSFVRQRKGLQQHISDHPRSVALRY